MGGAAAKDDPGKVRECCGQRHPCVLARCKQMLQPKMATGWWTAWRTQPLLHRPQQSALLLGWNMGVRNLTTGALFG